MKDQLQQLWGVHEVAQYLSVPVATLYQWRHHGYGPTGRRVGRYIRYDPREVRDWFAAQDDGVA